MEAMDTQPSQGKVLIQQGAEARLYRSEFFGKPSIIKQRFVKAYRVPSLDTKLTQRRMNQEVRSMARCRKNGIRAPAVYHLDTRDRSIHMEDIVGSVSLKEFIRSMDRGTQSGEERLRALVCDIGQILAKMHACDVVHGDLTTSNMLYCPTPGPEGEGEEGDGGEITLIDFGLSCVSALAEDKGVDLYVLERAFLSTHPDTEELFQSLLQSYCEASVGGARAVIAKLDEVRMRGRKRTMVG